MYKEILLNVVNNNPSLLEDTPFGYIKIRKKIESMTESEAKNFLLEISPTRKTVMSIAGVAIAISIPQYLVYRAIRSMFDKCSASCGAFALNTPKRQICMAKCNVMLYQKQLSQARKDGLGQEVIKAIESKLQSAEKKYKKYQIYAGKTGRNPNPNVTPDKDSMFKIPD